MEDNFYNDDEFEEFLRRQVKDHRMYPSDSVWRNILKKLHGDTNWPALTVAAFTFLGIIIAFSFYLSPSPDYFASPNSKVISQAEQKRISGENSKSDPLGIPCQKNVTEQRAIPFAQNNSGENLPDADVYSELKNNSSAYSNKEHNLDNNDERGLAYRNHKVPSQADVVNVVDISKQLQSPVNSNKTHFTISTSGLGSQLPNIALLNNNIAELNNSIPENTTKLSTETEFSKKVEFTNPSNFLPDLNTKQDKLLENAVTSLQKVRNSKFSYVVYITPSHSYRRLKQNPASSVKSGGPLALNYFVDVDKVARYNPGTGVEAGVNFMYNITDKLKIATGAQFNIRQYSLSAYIAPADVSTIALVSRSGSRDTINSYAVYRTSNGYVPTELVNRYYELSLPVGLIWEVAGNRIIQFNVAASVQPTYQINKNAYLISTDFKNYTVNPGLMNTWNINTNLEAYISIKSGDFKWQLGPQFRYQNLPTFINKYPIRENLIDYGLKIGVSKNLK